jgi:hypothetical protein
MRATRIALASAALALAASALGAGTAAATFHDVVVREIYPGSAISPGSEYVELQMYASGQQFVGGHAVSFYDGAGAHIGAAKFPSDLKNGVNQATMLVATPAAESEFGVTADLSLAPGLLSPGAGAVCWEAYDCVSWGAFSGSVKPSPGPPAAPGGIPDGMALRRTIAPGCPSLLEASDDRNDSAADFEAVFPSPRPNSAAPTERSCSGSSTGGGSQAGVGRGGSAPQTRLRGRRARRTSDRTPTFRFSSSLRGSSFQCRVDRRRFRRCRSPFTLGRLSLGRHVFWVWARSAAGVVDRSPATFRFRVLRRRRG